MDQFAISTDSKCIFCHMGEATGKWSLCDGCRSDLAQRSAQRRARMAPDHCMGCSTVRRIPPQFGAVYCPRCAQRFGVRG